MIETLLEKVIYNTAIKFLHSMALCVKSTMALGYIDFNVTKKNKQPKITDFPCKVKYVLGI